MDDAGRGRRGLRPSPAAELFELIESSWGLRSIVDPVDLGGSASLNLLLDDGHSRSVARVHRAHVTPARLESMQIARRHLAASGVPVAVPVMARSGLGWASFGSQLVEIEPFVVSDGCMDNLDRVRSALPLLGSIHASLCGVAELPAPDTEFANHLPARSAAAATARGTARIRSWSPSAFEERLADQADALAARVSALEAQRVDLPTQMVHGDFWDDNVLLASGAVVLVADLGFLGCRPRIDDLALTLYFTSLDIHDVAKEPDLLAELVGLYESGLDEPLSEHERLALPLAMARQPLWSIGVWVAELDDERTARAHLAGTTDALRWGTAVADDHESLQASLLAIT